MKVGDIVIVNKKLPNDSKLIFFENGQKMIIHEIVKKYCNCTKPEWTFYWTGFRREDPTHTYSTKCTDCGMDYVIKDNKIYLPAHYFTEISKKDVDLERIEAQLDLFKSFTRGNIKKESFRKILEMIDGNDPEMIQLGMHLLDELKEK